MVHACARLALALALLLVPGRAPAGAEAGAGAGAGASPPPEARVEGGLVRGLHLHSARGRPFAAFRGIPYAAAPVGPLRFQPPQPRQPWPGVWNASDYGSPCLQYDFTFGPDQPRVVGDEDCLFINVFTPRLNPPSAGEPLDVFVFIHGGAFIHGAGSLYGPKYLMDREVVAVTLNYRLGVLGFLSTADEVVPGNNGLKDQSLALRWINRNIAAFGGDPNKVTISGLSAGGASVLFHYLSPMSRGLFRRGISFSGTSVEPWAQNYEHRAKAFRVGRLVGCADVTAGELVACLRARPARKLVEQTEHFQVWRFNPFNPFGPIIPEPGADPFIAKQPADIIRDGEAQDLPWITSITTEEGLYPAAEFAAKDDALRELNEKWASIAPHLLHYNYTVRPEDMDDVSNRARRFYLEDKPISSRTAPELIQMISDRVFVVEVERAARLMAAANLAPVYFYKFSYRGADSISNAMSKTTINMGVAHGDDVAYIVDEPFMNPATTAQDRAMTDLMLDVCTGFALTGSPTPAGRGVSWSPLKPRSKLLDYLHIASPSDLRMEASSDLGNRAFWDSLPIREPQIGPASNEKTEL